MKKMLFFAAIALAALGSCTSDEFVGENNPNETNENYANAIVFGTGVKAVTRGTSTDAALLNNNFVLFGSKGDPTRTTVFNNYQANFVQNTSNTTESNSSGWEYVGYKNLPSGVGTNVGVTNYATLAANSSAIDQTIKYWDYAVSQYDFAAYSLGTGHSVTTGEGESATTSTTYATASAIDFANLATGAYTLTGSAEELTACYISDLVTAYNHDNVSDYGQPVQFSFRSLGTKIRLAFYETVPGYSVKDVQFYTSSSATLANDGTQNDPTLFTANAVLPSGSGTMTVTFPTTGFNKRPGGTSANTNYNKAHVAFSTTSTANLSSTLTFEDLANLAARDYKEAEGNYYIGRASNAATYAGGLVNGTGKYYTFLPNETGANLQLRIKYTLVSRDGSGEELTVDNATAVIPAELAQWQPNYAYTYIFKIGDMTNGSTGVDGNENVVTGLTPITLDAVVVNSETGVQETITTVSEPSITTYTKGVVVTTNDEYVAGNNIYVIVNNGTSNEKLTNKAKLYIVTIEEGATQTISEESVANAIASNTDGYDIGEVLTSGTSLTNYYTYDSGSKTYTAASGTADGSTTYYKPASYSVKDANGKKLVVNEVANDADDKLNIVGAIAAADSPTGNEINIGENKVGKFTAGAAGTVYAFQYKVSDAVAESAAGTYDETSANEYNATLPGAISTSDVAFSFTSYGKQVDGENVTYTPQYGSGKVKVVSQAGGWTTVLVISNVSTDTNAPDFVGQQFMVNATTLDENTYYQLYSTAGVAQEIYVKIENYTLDATDVNNYNKTLTGNVTAGQTKPAVTAQPAKYQYKIIKIKK